MESNIIEFAYCYELPIDITKLLIENIKSLKYLTDPRIGDVRITKFSDFDSIVDIAKCLQRVKSLEYKIMNRAGLHIPYVYERSCIIINCPDTTFQIIVSKCTCTFKYQDFYIPIIRSRTFTYLKSCNLIDNKLITSWQNIDRDL